MGVDDVGFKAREEGRDVKAPSRPVGLDLLVVHGVENRARVWHDVAHSGYGKPKLSTTKNERVNPIAIDPSDSGVRVIRRNPDDHALLPAGCFGVAHEGIEGDAAAGQGRPLREQMEDSHGFVIVAWNQVGGSDGCEEGRAG